MRVKPTKPLWSEYLAFSFLSHEMSEMSNGRFATSRCSHEARYNVIRQVQDRNFLGGKCESAPQGAFNTLNYFWFRSIILPDNFEISFLLQEIVHSFRFAGENSPHLEEYIRLIKVSREKQRARPFRCNRD